VKRAQLASVRSWSLAGVLIDEIACTFPTLKGLFERPVRSDQFGDRYSINVSSGVSDQGVRTFSTPPAPVDTMLSNNFSI